MTEITADAMASIMSGNPSPIPTHENRPQPSVAYMLEVTLDILNGRFIFRYSGFWKQRFTGTDEQKHAEFLQWIEEEVKNPTTANALNSFDSTPNIRKPSKMSFKCKDLVYLVFKLSPSINWRFTADGPPISMDRFWDGKDVFFNATNLDEYGHETTPAKNNQFNYAYVIVNCPNGKPGPGPAIEARFNLHVDLMEGPNDEDPYVPIIIDPDVRNPGGSGGN